MKTKADAWNRTERLPGRRDAWKERDEAIHVRDICGFFSGSLLLCAASLCEPVLGDFRRGGIKLLWLTVNFMTQSQASFLRSGGQFLKLTTPTTNDSKSRDEFFDVLPTRIRS